MTALEVPAELELAVADSADGVELLELQLATNSPLAASTPIQVERFTRHTPSVFGTAPARRNASTEVGRAADP
ncbi:MAG: hypothetical protein ABJD68_06155, partial [Nakamurella sp.]